MTKEIRESIVSTIVFKIGNWNSLFCVIFLVLQRFNFLMSPWLLSRMAYGYVEDGKRVFAFKVDAETLGVCGWQCWFLKPSRTEVPIPARPDVFCLTAYVVEASGFITSRWNPVGSSELRIASWLISAHLWSCSLNNSQFSFAYMASPNEASWWYKKKIAKFGVLCSGIYWVPQKL